MVKRRSFPGIKGLATVKASNSSDKISDPEVDKTRLYSQVLNDIKFILKSTQFSVPGFVYIFVQQFSLV